MLYLDVGGLKYTTTIATLRAEKGSMFEAMFSGHYPIKKQLDGTVFIDRDGRHFHYILNYLRGSVTALEDLPLDEIVLKELMKEADFYQLLGLKSILSFGIERTENVCEKELVVQEDISDFLTLNETKKEIIFENKKLDNLNFTNISFKHNASFKRCSMLKAVFTSCRFVGSIEVVFERCSLAGAMFNSCSFSGNCDVTFRKSDLIGGSFSSSSFEASKISFDQTDLRNCDLRNIPNMIKKIREKKVTFNQARYIDGACFDREQIKTVIKQMYSLE